MTRSLLLLCVALSASSASAQVCYRLPFSNPNLSDGWGSTCCGRTNPHRGVDFPQRSGTAIPSVAAGTVVLRTSSSCLGNVVVVKHDDGWFSSYCHMNAQSPLAVGTRVALGQTIGQVGNTGTCTTGPHLHLTMSQTQGGWGSGTTVDPYKHIIARQNCNQTPVGYLDEVNCQKVRGWAHDPGVAAPIDVHVYFDGPTGDPKGKGFSTRAEINRPDLCASVGCNHGFEMGVPLSFFDDRDHPVYAYAIDTGGGTNPQLNGAPKTLRCAEAPLPEPEGGVVRRKVADPASLAAWKFSEVNIAPMTDAKLLALPHAPQLSAQPELIKIEGNDTVYVREYGVLRSIASIAELSAWKFSVPAIVTVAPADVADDLRGPKWQPFPFLAKGSGVDVFVLDAPPMLWGEVTGDTIPAAMQVGTQASATVTLKNRGALTWSDAVLLAPLPKDEASVFCDPSWPSCTRVSPLVATATGAETTLSFTLTAPATAGSVEQCFSLVTGTHWFDAEGHGGPTFCKTIEVTSAPVEPDGAGGGVGGGGVANQPQTPDMAVSGCSCDASSGASWLALLGLLTSVRAARWRARRQD